MSDDLSYSLGLQIENFQQGAHEAIAQTREIHHELRGIRTAIEAGGVGVIAISFLRDVADWAEKSGDKLDSNVQALIRWKHAAADGGDAIKGFAAGLIGPIIKAGEGLGMMLRGIYEGVHNPSSTKSPLQMLKNIAQAWKDIGAAEFTSQALDQQQLTDGANRTKQLDEQAAKLKEIRAEAAKLGQADMDYNFSQLSTAQQLNQLLSIRKLIESDLANFKGKEPDREKLINELTANGTEIAKTRDKLAKEGVKTEKDLTAELERQARIAEKARKDEEGRAQAAKMTQQAYESIMFGVTNGGYSSQQIQEASSGALSEAVRRNKQKLSGLDSNPGSAFDYGNSLEITRLNNENARIQAELSLRSGISRDRATLGDAGARRSFQGDPLVYDKLVQQFGGSQNEQQKQTQLLQDIKDQQRRGLKVVPLGTTGTLPAQNPAGPSIPS